MNLNTPQGAIEITEPEDLQLNSLRHALPFGLVRYQTPVHGAEYGIVIQCGEEPVWTIKQQGPDIPEDLLPTIHMQHSLLIAASIGHYLNAGFEGCLMPTLYFKKKPSGIETGIAYFGSPAPSEMQPAALSPQTVFDSQLGHGFTAMTTRFIRELKHQSKQSRIPLQPCIGLDPRPITKLGTLILGFLIHGQNVYCLKPAITESNPLWTALRSSGVTQLHDLPSIPAKITESQLTLAKPNT
jgi:hypothetical protein